MGGAQRLEWAQVRTMAADGVSQREIAARLGTNRRTLSRMLAANEPGGATGVAGRPVRGRGIRVTVEPV
jgi:DNA invertase Pin-like site-specific DNA recombinase